VECGISAVHLSLTIYHLQLTIAVYTTHWITYVGEDVALWISVRRMFRGFR